MATKIKPLHDRIVVKRHESMKQTESGIVFSSGAVEQTCTATVVAVGPGKKQKDGTLRTLTCAVGDKIAMDSLAGRKVKINGEPLLVLYEAEIFGILDRETEE